MDNTNLLRIEGLHKSFPGVKVLNDISIDFKAGKVHALIGENGAGKSTFMNILFGYHHADEGKLIWQGKEIKIDSPLAAQKIGISMIHQENSLIPYLNVMDNIYLGHYPNIQGFVRKNEIHLKVKKLLDELEIEDIKTTMIVENLSVAQKQLMEIVKALSIKPKLLMMDEPTAALTAKETRILMRIIEKLRNNGVSIIYVSHRLEEVFDIADTISVLRDGNLITTRAKEEMTIRETISLMVGRDLGHQMDEIKKEHSYSETSEVMLEVKDFNLSGKFSNISFEVKKGEILGFGGLVGAGRSELMEAIFGYVPQETGQLLIKGEAVQIDSPYKAIKNKIALVPEERKVKGIFQGLSVAENINISSYKKLRRSLIISRRKEIIEAKNYVKLLNIKTTSIKKKVGNLSGGNQQKTILGRWLQTKPEILILDEPTHGIDVGAKAEIYKIIEDMSKAGITILLISSELPELLLLSHRIIVMHNGKISGILDKSEFSQENVMTLATGQNNQFKHNA